jgi:hypothetical protein
MHSVQAKRGCRVAGKIIAIYIAEKGSIPLSQSVAKVEADRGIVGDR